MRPANSVLSTPSESILLSGALSFLPICIILLPVFRTFHSHVQNLISKNIYSGLTYWGAGRGGRWYIVYTSAILGLSAVLGRVYTSAILGLSEGGEYRRDNVH